MATEQNKDNAVRILNAFRNDYPAYADRLPEVTVNNIAEVGGQIVNNKGMFNDFTGVIDKISETFLTSPKFNNPLAKHKRTASEYGATIEQIYVGLVESKVFRSDESARALFKKEPPNLDTAYFRINRQDRYDVTLDEINIKKMMKTGDGFANIIQMIESSTVTSNNFDEYELMKKLFSGAVQSGNVFYVVVGDIHNDREALDLYSEKIREYAVLAQYMNKFNAKGVLNASPEDDMTHYISARTSARVDVQVLANAFNENYVTGTVTEERLDNLGDPNIVSMLVDNDFLLIFEHLAETRRQSDAAALTENLFYHVHQTIARSPFATAIAFVKELPEGITARLSVDKTIATVNSSFKGEPQELVVTASVNGFDTGNGEGLEPFTLTATADTAGVDIVVEEDVVTITPNAQAQPGESFTVTYTATFTDDLGDATGTAVTKGHYNITQNYKA